jgi:hypothetical protein
MEAAEVPAACLPGCQPPPPPPPLSANPICVLLEADWCHTGVGFGRRFQLPLR